MSTSDRPASPTPSERERKDAEDRKREEEEQAKLPYKWTQTLTEADVTVPIAANYKARDLIVELKKTKLKVQIKGQDPIIDVRDSKPLTFSPLECQLTLPLSLPTGRLPPPYPSRRLHLDPRNHADRQRYLRPPCQSPRLVLVGTHHHLRAQDRHDQDHAREQQAVGAGRRDEGYGREDDVRPGDEETGKADE
jgi:hypothetical protein